MRFVALCAMFALALGSVGAAFAQSSPASAPTGNADQELQQAFSAMSAANVTAMMNASDALKAQQAFQQAFQAWRTAQQGREASMQRQLASVNRALQSEQKTELAMRGRLQEAELQADQNAHRPQTPRVPRAPNYSNTGPNLPQSHPAPSNALPHANVPHSPGPQSHPVPTSSASSSHTLPAGSTTGPHPVGPQSRPQSASGVTPAWEMHR